MLIGTNRELNTEENDLANLKDKADIYPSSFKYKQRMPRNISSFLKRTPLFDHLETKDAHGTLCSA